MKQITIDEATKITALWDEDSMSAPAFAKLCLTGKSSIYRGIENKQIETIKIGHRTLIEPFTTMNLTYLYESIGESLSTKILQYCPNKNGDLVQDKGYTKILKLYKMVKAELTLLNKELLEERKQA